MAPTLGKRKRRDQIDSPTLQVSGQDDAANEHLQALFRQHFETKFKPLQPLTNKPPSDIFPVLTTTPDSECSDFDSDWTGLSDSDSYPDVQIVSHESPINFKPSDIPKSELNHFMESSPSFPTQKATT